MNNLHHALVSVRVSLSPDEYTTAIFGGTGPDNNHLLFRHLGCLHDGIRASIRVPDQGVILEIEDTGVGCLGRVFGLGRYEESREFPVQLIGTVGLQGH